MKIRLDESAARVWQEYIEHSEQGYRAHVGRIVDMPVQYGSHCRTSLSFRAITDYFKDRTDLHVRVRLPGEPPMRYGPYKPIPRALP